MKVIIAGSRDITDPNILLLALKDAIAPDLYITEVVCGMARGVDMLGWNWAKTNNIPVKEFPADWDTHNLGAGPIRNRQMAMYADGLIAIWDGSSRGTLNMIKQARECGLKTFVYRLGNNPNVTRNP